MSSERRMTRNRDSSRSMTGSQDVRRGKKVKTRFGIKVRSYPKTFGSQYMQTKCETKTLLRTEAKAVHAELGTTPAVDCRTP